MKRTAIALSLALTALTALGQGTLNFNNRVSADGINAPVTYEGVGVAGPAYLAQLYVFNPSTSAYVAVGAPTAFSSNVALKGYVNGGEVTVPFLAGGASAQVLMKAWNAAAGASFEAAAANVAAGIVGQTAAPITVVLGSGPPNTPPNMIGLQGFAVTAVIPEPSTIALGLLGVAGLLIRRRK